MNQTKYSIINNCKSLLLSCFFGALMAVNCCLFIVPNNFASSGVEGISIMIQRLSGFNLSYIQLFINAPLCVFAFFCVNKKFAVDTAVYSVSYLIFYMICEKTGLEKYRYYSEGIDTIYPIIIAGVLTGISYGVLYSINSSTGGIDIVSRYINLKKPRFNFFYVTFLINATIAIVSGFVFCEVKDGTAIYSYRPVCMCVLCDFISNVIGDKIISRSEIACKYFIIADDIEAIEKEIAEKLVHTSTRYYGVGSYTKTEKPSLMCIVTKSETPVIEDILKDHPECFAYTEPVSKVFGYFDKKIKKEK